MKFQERGSTAKKHFQISLAKSIIRLIACLCLAYDDVVGTAVLLGFAEILGVYEEIA